MDASPNTIGELLRTQVILLVGSSIMRDHAIAGLKVKEAVKEQGAKLVTINPCATKADEWATLTVQPENQVGFLKQIAACLLEMGKKTDKVNNLEAFMENLDGLTITDEARQVAELYASAKTAMIVFDQSQVSPEAAQILASLAVISGHIGKPRRGLIQLKPQNNSQAVSLMNIHGDASGLDQLLKQEQLKALLLFGENYPMESLKKLEFLAVMDTHLTPTAEMADVVLPAASFAESQGTYTSGERRVQKVVQALKPLAGWENWQVINELSTILRLPFNYNKFQHLAEDLGVTMDGYEQVHSMGETSGFWPLGSSPVLYEEGFGFEDGTARLPLVDEAPLFDEAASTHYVTTSFMKYLEEEGLDRC